LRVSFTTLGKRALRRLGLVVHRWPIVRFEGMADALELLRMSGFRPDVVVDVGANRGTWATLAHATFPEAAFHLVEPQPGCLPSLRAFAAAKRNAQIHATAVTAPGITRISMTGGGATGDGTGNFIPSGASVADADTVTYPATTLDQLLANTTPASILLKLDVEGHELPVLEGGRAMLQHTDVVIAEFWLFRIFGQQMTVFSELLQWFEAADFELYDFASLNGRRRDQRLRSGYAIFVRRGSALLRDVNWQ